MKEKKVKVCILCALILVVLVLGLTIQTRACSIDFGAAQDHVSQTISQEIQRNPDWFEDWFKEIIGRWK